MLLIAATTPFLLLLLFAFLLARGVLALLFFFPPLRSWRLLLTLVQPWLWLLPTILNFRANLHFPLNRSSLPRPFLIVLLHYRVTRLVTVIPLLELLLLLQLAGIAIP